MITKKCKICGKIFYPKNSQHKYCSSECKKKAKNISRHKKYKSRKPVTKVCEICGKTFEGHGNAKYCGNECREEAKRVLNRERYKTAKPVTKVCEICGKTFEGRGNAKYCSDECRKKGVKMSVEKNKYKRIFIPLIKTCKICGKNYVSVFENSVYCSDECRKDGNRDIVNKSWKKISEKKIDELAERYDGNLDLILEDCPTCWHKREAIMQVEYGVSYAEAMSQKKKLNPVCEITGEFGDLVIHHLDSFNLCPEKGADLDNLVRVKREIHDEFHKIYGRGNNTRAQWFEFLENMGFVSRPSVSKIKCIIDEEIDDGVFISRPSVSKIMEE